MSLDMPPLTRADLNACKHSSWLPNFKALTPKATVLPLSLDFVAYLRKDGIFLPDPNGLSYADADSDEEDNQFSFPALHDEIQAAIEKYGAVFPKLNWSSPQDAEWMIASPSLRCESPEDVFLLLKSSDFVTHDLEQAYDACVGAEEMVRYAQISRVSLLCAR
jgi:hypothetical protein